MKLSKADRRRIRIRKRAIRRLAHRKMKHRFVDHPRYGNQPISSGEHFSIEEVRNAHWQYSRSRYDRNDQKMIFPATAIRANAAKQNFSTYPRRLYVDIARPCRKCRRWFIFYALEQKYWFETLGFYVDADCVNCPDCRQVEHNLKRNIDRYGALLAKDNKTTAEWQELSELGDLLYAEGYIKKAETLRKTRKPKRMTTVK